MGYFVDCEQCGEEIPTLSDVAMSINTGISTYHFCSCACFTNWFNAVTHQSKYLYDRVPSKILTPAIIREKLKDDPAFGEGGYGRIMVDYISSMRCYNVKFEIRLGVEMTISNEELDRSIIDIVGVKSESSTRAIWDEVLKQGLENYERIYKTHYCRLSLDGCKHCRLSNPSEFGYDVAQRS